MSQNKIVGICFVVFALIAGSSIILVKMGANDRGRLHKAITTTRNDAHIIASKDVAWTVASRDTAFSSDVYVVKLKLVGGDTTLKLNRYQSQDYLGWSDAEIGSQVRLRLNNSLQSAKLSDYLIPYH